MIGLEDGPQPEVSGVVMLSAAKHLVFSIGDPSPRSGSRAATTEPYSKLIQARNNCYNGILAGESVSTEFM